MIKQLLSRIIDEYRFNESLDKVSIKLSELDEGYADILCRIDLASNREEFSRDIREYYKNMKWSLEILDYLLPLFFVTLKIVARHGKEIYFSSNSVGLPEKIAPPISFNTLFEELTTWDYGESIDCLKYMNLPQNEWDIRHLIWAFKNDPNKQDRQYSYRAALNEIVPKYERKLRDTFGSLLSDMTLVCLPASNSEKNRRRWQEFSKKVCSDLDMWNAYDYIHIEQEAVPKHLGGDGQAVLSFNQSFFNGKYVILCDDIKTTGSSLQRMKYKLESMGATVICSLTIGITVHE